MAHLVLTSHRTVSSCRIHSIAVESYEGPILASKVLYVGLLQYTYASCNSHTHQYQLLSDMHTIPSSGTRKDIRLEESAQSPSLSELDICTMPVRYLMMIRLEGRTAEYINGSQGGRKYLPVCPLPLKVTV